MASRALWKSSIAFILLTGLASCSDETPAPSPTHSVVTEPPAADPVAEVDQSELRTDIGEPTPTPEESATSETDGQVVSALSPEQELRAIGEALYDGTNRYLGQESLREFRRTLARPTLTAGQRVRTQSQMVLRLLELGDVSDAVAEIEDVFRSLSAEELQRMSDLYRLRGLVYLRQAEVENCIARHHADCCLFPLSGKAIHEVVGPAEMARESLLQYLEHKPGDLRGWWLLNIAAMAVGEYPDGVPERFRFDPAAFESEQSIARFRDIAPSLGVDALNLCGGVIVEDFDGDGLLDILTSTYDPLGPLTFYVNRGDGTFEDRSMESGATSQYGGLNIVGTDYDNDGDVDALVLRGAWLFDDGRIRNSLIRNNGDGTFTDVTHEAGMAIPAYPTQAAAWADFDNDGDLDVYIGNESRVRREPRANYPGQLFINNGDGTFSDNALAAGVRNDRYCKGVAAGDYDNDGDMDLYVSNVGPNALFRNDGDGTFTNVTSEAGVRNPDARSFATWFFDYDNDGLLDLFCAAYHANITDLAAAALGRPHQATPPALYHNNGDGTFTDVAKEVGLDRVILPMGANFGDLDNDGWLDIYLTTGDPDYQTLMPNVMLRNDGGRRFVDVTTAGGFGHLQKGHGIAFADLDNDGDQDIYHQLGGFFPGDKYQNVLFENPGNDSHSLTIRLVGTESNRAGFGARIRVTVQTPGGERAIHRAVGAVSSFGGSPFRQEIGLGDATSIREVRITWPKSGRVQTFNDVPLDSMIRVEEDAEAFEVIERRQVKLAGPQT